MRDTAWPDERHMTHIEPVRIKDGFTLQEHRSNGTYDEVWLLTPEDVISHLVARMFPLGDGPRRLSDLHEKLGAFLAHKARKALKL